MKTTKSKLFLTLFLVYLFYLSPNYRSAHTERYIALTKAIVDNHTFLTGPATPDYAIYKGRYYIGAAPALAFLSVPIYIALRPVKSLPFYPNFEGEILRFFFILFLPFACGIAIALLLYDILGGFDVEEKGKILITLASSFGTILFIYSTRYATHTISAFALFSAFYILFRDKRRLYLLGGLCAGIAVLSEYTLIIPVFLIIIYGFWKRRKMLSFLTGLFLMSLLYMYYHYACFENPFMPATTYNWMIGPHSWSLPRIDVLFDFTFGTYRGLFSYMPVTLLSVYGLCRFFIRQDRRFVKEMALILTLSLTILICAVSYVSFAKNKGDAQGADFGPRYLIASIPFLMIPLAFVSYKAIFWVALASVFINWCGVQYGDVSHVHSHITTFLARGLNSSWCEFIYRIAHPDGPYSSYSPFMPFIILLGIVYMIWRPNRASSASGYYR